MIYKSSYWLCLFLIFLMPWERMVHFGSLGTISRLMGIFVSAVWMLSAVSNGVRRLKPIHSLVFGLFLLNFFSVFWSIDAKESLIRTATYLRAAILLVIFWDLFRSKDSIRNALQAYVLGGAVPALAVVRNFLSGAEAVYGRYATGTGGTESGDNMNTTAMILAMTIPMAFHLAMTSNASLRGRGLFSMGGDALMRIFNLGYIFLALFAICLTGTRFGLVMTAPVWVYAGFMLIRSNPVVAVLVAVVMGLGIVGVAQMLPKALADRLGSTTEEVSSGDLNGRMGAWRVAGMTFADYPVLGTGSATSELATIPYWGYPFSTHNSFLAILVELGLVGLVAVASLILLVFYYAWNVPDSTSYFWLTTLCVWLLGNMPITCFHSKPTWLVFGMLTCAYYAAVHETDSVDESNAVDLGPPALSGAQF